MACTCQSCGQHYKVDVLVADDLWERIKPAQAGPGQGLLCGACILTRIEVMGRYAAYHLSPKRDSNDGR